MTLTPAPCQLCDDPSCEGPHVDWDPQGNVRIAWTCEAAGGEVDALIAYYTPRSNSEEEAA